MNIKELREICQKEKLTRNKGLTLLNRKISIYVTKILIACNISANQASVSGIVIGVLGSCMFIPGDFSFNICGVILLYLSLLCDQVDGELARYYKTVNLNGVYIDEIRHLLIYSITVFCLSFPAAQNMGSNLAFLFGFFGAITLTISRVEERLPYQIFTEKIILKDNFTGGNSALFEFDNGAFDNDGVKINPNTETGSSHSLRKQVSFLFYNGFQYLSHQVWIIIWLFSVTIIDHYILDQNTFSAFINSQLLLFFLFTCYGPLVFIKTVYGHFEEERIVQVCKQIQTKGNHMPRKTINA